MGLIHPLWKPLAMPLAMPDHVLGLGANWAVLLPFALFWAAICTAGLVIAVRVHHRGVPYRQASMRKALLHPAALAAAVLLAGSVWQGFAIHRTLMGDFALISADENARRRADYERRYSHWQSRPQPHIAEVHSFVDFGDDGHSADLRVALQLVNRTNQPIERILVGRNLIDVTGKVAIAGAISEFREIGRASRRERVCPYV